MDADSVRTHKAIRIPEALSPTTRPGPRCFRCPSSTGTAPRRLRLRYPALRVFLDGCRPTSALANEPLTPSPSGAHPTTVCSDFAWRLLRIPPCGHILLACSPALLFPPIHLTSGLVSEHPSKRPRTCAHGVQSCIPHAPRSLIPAHDLFSDHACYCLSYLRFNRAAQPVGQIFDTNRLGGPTLLYPHRRAVFGSLLLSRPVQRTSAAHPPAGVSGDNVRKQR